MPVRADYFKLGLFVVAAAAVAIAAVIVFGAGALFRKHIDIETYVDESVRTLEVGSAVKFRGVDVGDVREITFVRTRLARDHPDFIRYGRYVLIRMSLYADVFEDLTGEDVDPILRRLIEDGLRIRLASQGLTGQTHIEVDYVDPAQNPPLAISWQPRAHYIPSAPSVMTKLTETADRVFAQIEEADIPNIAASLDRFLVVSTQVVQEARLSLLSDKVLALVGEVGETNERVQALLGDSALGNIPDDIAGAVAAGRALVDRSSEVVDSLLADVGAASRSMRASAESIEAMATSEELRTSFSELARTSPAIRKAAEELPKTLASLNAGLRRAGRLFSGREGDLEVLLENLRVVSENARILSESIKVFPGEILFGNPPDPVEGSQR